MNRGKSSPLAPALHALEDSAALDRLTSVGRRISGMVAGDGARRDLLQGAWLGHALHPLVIEVPMGTWISALALDLVGGDKAGDDAQVLTGIGILAAVPAALTGWAEFQQAGVKGQRVAVVHAGANAAGLAAQTASYVARRAGHHRLGALLGAGAMTMVGAAGYLGGHLAAARKIGSHDPSFGPESATGTTPRD